MCNQITCKAYNGIKIFSHVIENLARYVYKYGLTSSHG